MVCPMRAPYSLLVGRLRELKLQALHFRRLQTKLTVLYAGFFAALLGVISLVVLAAVGADAQRTVRRELAASGVVFERVWAQRAGHLQEDGVLLSRDFGFRSAVATRDLPTIRSALGNLQARLNADRALLIVPDGDAIAADGRLVRIEGTALSALQSDDVESGVLTLEGSAYQAVSVPISPGGTEGWVVFAVRLGASEMRSLQSMAAIPLDAAVVYRIKPGLWREGSAEHGGLLDAESARALDRGPTENADEPDRIDGRGGRSLALIKPLRVFDPGRPAVLFLRYPVAEAFAQYRLLAALLAGTAALGLVVLLGGTFLLARTVTRPVSDLEDAAERLRRGERAEVRVQSRDEIGRLAGAFNAMTEEIARRERDLGAALHQAEAANRAKSAFLTNMSHEVRTPLNGVLGVASVLARTRLGPKQAKMVRIIENSAGVLQRVLTDVLDLARVEAGRLEIVTSSVDLGDVIDRLAEAYEVQCEAQGLAFALAFEPGARRHVTGDRDRLEQILGNLLNNAMKFTASGRVTFRIARGADDLYRFEVEDTGIGFDQGVADQLFQPFQQADNTITRRFGGSGLGLSISRELARAMGGDLTGVGRPGAGACFTLDLPMPACEPPQALVPSPTSADAQDGRRPRVLVADDHETNRTLVSLILESVGVEVVGVENGAEAVDAWARGGFDLVLMDMQMPVMDGLSAIQEIRRREADAGQARSAILMLSANAMPEHLEAASVAGADGHVAKPVTAKVLIDAAERAFTQGDAAAAA